MPDFVDADLLHRTILDDPKGNDALRLPSVTYLVGWDAVDLGKWIVSLKGGHDTWLLAT
ncbi:MAG TPA: hypothetical protein VFM55_13405 [Micromonosporaceae bacterium]|nr:hypothetical protein [Micromonosporaceae bacterium]